MSYLTISKVLTAFALSCGFSAMIVVVAFRVYFRKRRLSQSRSARKRIAFFHPYCSSGGGGERVLWKIVQALDELNAEGISYEIVIYTVDVESERFTEQLFQDVKARFAIHEPTSVKVSFVHLNQHAHLLAKAARFSLVAESWGTMRFAFEALVACTPDVFIDTTGCAFTFLVARVFAGCDVAAYVHYPTISTDMLRLVWDRRPTYNNDSSVTSSSMTTFVKLVYYSLFAAAYAFAGSMCKLVMVNSSWTYGHISTLWMGAYGRISIVFPPCDTQSLKNLPLERVRPIIVSIGQFRPEKEHALQILSFAKLLNDYNNWKGAKLVLIGSCRGPEDDVRVRKLRALVVSLKLVDCIDFVLNEPHDVVKKWFAEGSVGLHTMWNEHFGIGVVEMMAAGLLVVAHNSGGPKADIVVPADDQQTGFLAVSVSEFACAMNQALSLGQAEAKQMRSRARASTMRFSDETFNLSIKKAMLESGLLQ